MLKSVSGHRSKEGENMAGFSIEKSKQKITDLQKEVGEKKEKLQNLETSKQELLSTITELSGANISEETKEKSTAALNLELSKVSDQGQKLSDEVGEKIKEYETEMQEVQEVSESNAEKQESLREKKTILTHFNMGELMDSSMRELENEEKQLGELKQTIIEAREESEDLAKRASLL